MRGLHRGGLALGREGRYTLVHKFSEDPIGTLWLAQDVAPWPTATIRVLRDDLVADPRFVKCLLSELRKVWPRLKHPNAPSIISYTGDRHAPIRFLVMPPFQGESLAQRVLRAGPLGLAEAARIASQIESALEAAHEIGLVHGGVTAHSVVLTARGRVEVIDFGIRIALWAAARDGHRPAHDMSSGFDVASASSRPDADTDVRSLDRLMQHMLSGSQPAAEDELATLVDLVLATKPPGTRDAAGVAEHVGRELRLTAPTRIFTPASGSPTGVRRGLRVVGRPVVRAPRAVVSMLGGAGRAMTRAVAWIGRGVASVLYRSAESAGTFAWFMRAVVSASARSRWAVGRAVAWFAGGFASAIATPARALGSALAWLARVAASIRAEIGRAVGRAVAGRARAALSAIGGVARGVVGLVLAVGAFLAGAGHASIRSVIRYPKRPATVPLSLAFIAVATTATIGFVLSRPSSDGRHPVEPIQQPPPAAMSAPPTGVTVPQVDGLSAMEAGRMLARAGLPIADAVPTLGPPGQVVGTDPPGSQIVDPGTPIIILVGAPPERLETNP